MLPYLLTLLIAFALGLVVGALYVCAVRFELDT